MFALRIAALVAAAALAAVAAGTAGAGTSTDALASVPVAGTTSGGGTFTGTLEITGFAVENGTVVAVGSISGTLTDASGTTVVSDVATVAPLQQAQQAGCTLFSISIGPIDVNVAGLVVVHIEPIAVDVRLEGLLGTLLCAILGGLGGAPAPATAG
jgi:hypothetical protein